MTKVTEEATRTLCCSMLNPSNPVILAEGPSSGTSRVTTAPTIRLRIGKAPKTQSNYKVRPQSLMPKPSLLIYQPPVMSWKRISRKCNSRYITHLLTDVWRCPKRSRLLQGRMQCIVHIPVVRRPARKKQVLIQNRDVFNAGFQ